GDGRATERSPWMVHGDAMVRMVTQDAFVGEHTPEITVAVTDTGTEGLGTTDDAGKYTLPNTMNPDAGADSGEYAARESGTNVGGIGQTGLGVLENRPVSGYVWARSDTLRELTVMMEWGDGPGDTQKIRIPVTSEYTKAEFTFHPTATSQRATFFILSEEAGSFQVGTASLMPGDHVDGLRADTLRELKRLDSPVYRWPGGNFVSGYDWKDGIGDRDRRPPRKNPAWLGVESNDMGIDEFMTFCRHLGTEPYIAVNSGLGGVESAAEEVEYCNGSAETPMGKWRAQNGHAQPYGVKFWSIGNEMYGSWQLGVMPQDRYIVKHREFCEAMRNVDPTIELVAVGAVGKWSENMMSQCADAMEMISEHVYWQDRRSVLTHIRQATDSIRNIAAAHRSYRERFDSLKGKDIRICLDEWNYWYGPHYFGELGTRYFLKDGLGCAAALNEMFRNSDMYRMANYAQTVNVIGCIKTNSIHAAMETTGLVLVMYRHQYGTRPVATQTASRFDVQAAMTEDRSQLTISVVNPNGAQVTMPLELTGVELTGTGRIFQLAGDDPMAYNDPEDPGKLEIVERPVEGVNDTLTVPAYSATIFVLDVVK
ncbi:MAG: alpha-L-arabinofuranosidase C-terminal domain-containing protein, partial [Planctomycetia bacterium]|nr:alpha-L-arabinofuranosidase C-terminal domain-containing protein [Planctomycetia bacterium]